MWLGALAFLASWFLPVLDDVPGWMAFRYALAPLVPFRDAGSQAWLGRQCAAGAERADQRGCS